MAKFSFISLSLGLLCCLQGVAAATPPSETLLPSTTKGFLSVPDVELLQDRWNETQLGRMMHDPVMQPFVEDLRDQIKNKLSTSRVRLGLTLDDLQDIYGGELCLAMLQPEDDVQPYATVLLVDVAGHVKQAQAVLDKANKSLLDQGATQRSLDIDGVDVTVFNLPQKRLDSPTVEAFHAIHRDTLLVCDHKVVCQQIISRLNGTAGDTLSQVEAFEVAMSRCARESGDMAPHIRWFVEPFGYALAVRASGGGRKRKGADLLKVLPNQGFDAFKGIGGYVFLAVGDQELLHRTMIYAPPIERGAEQSPQERYTLAARMLDFPNTDNLQPQTFVSRDLGAYLSFNWRMVDAFEHSKTLVNELLGGGKDDDLMEEVIVGLARDKDGPQVDLRKDFVHHFAERVSLIADCRRPVTPDSERIMVTIELTNPEAVRAAVDKAFSADPEAQKREFEGHVIWEIIKDNAPVEVDELEIDSGLEVFDPFSSDNVPQEVLAEEEEEAKILPNSAIAVVYDHLIVASHVDVIVEMLQRPIGTDLLSAAADFQQIEDALAKIGAGASSFRFFARTDETYRPTYELIRQGKMPEAKTLLAKLLNRLLGPDEKGILREQQIDGSKMPEFDAVRRYLGPAGLYVQSEFEGWYMAGCLLSKELRLAEAPAEQQND